MLLQIKYEMLSWHTHSILIIASAILHNEYDKVSIYRDMHLYLRSGSQPIPYHTTKNIHYYTHYMNFVTDSSSANLHLVTHPYSGSLKKEQICY